MGDVENDKEIEDVGFLKFFQCKGEWGYPLDVRIASYKTGEIKDIEVHGANLDEFLECINMRVEIDNCGVGIEFYQPRSIYIVKYRDGYVELRATLPIQTIMQNYIYERCEGHSLYDCIKEIVDEYLSIDYFDMYKTKDTELDSPNGTYLIILEDGKVYEVHRDGYEVWVKVKEEEGVDKEMDEGKWVMPLPKL